MGRLPISEGVAVKIGEWLDLDRNTSHLELTAQRDAIRIKSWEDHGRRVWSIGLPLGSGYQGNEFRELSEAKLFATNTLRERCAEVVAALDMTKESNGETKK